MIGLMKRETWEREEIVYRKQLLNQVVLIADLTILKAWVLGLN